jgi:hypothetical protein
MDALSIGVVKPMLRTVQISIEPIVIPFPGLVGQQCFKYAKTNQRHTKAR